MFIQANTDRTQSGAGKFKNKKGFSVPPVETNTATVPGMDPCRMKSSREGKWSQRVKMKWD